MHCKTEYILFSLYMCDSNFVVKCQMNLYVDYIDLDTRNPYLQVQASYV